MIGQAKQRLLPSLLSEKAIASRLEANPMRLEPIAPEAGGHRY